MEVTLIDYMGDDLRVVNAARVSFAKESFWEPIIYTDPDGTRHREEFPKVLSEQDQKLINYLAKHNHWTPFSHVQITLREKVPIFVARQRFKHMVGFSYNEVSRRYVDSPPEFFFPDGWRGKAENKKQGSTDEVVFDTNNILIKIAGDRKDGSRAESGEFNYNGLMRICEAFYQGLLDNGVAPEQARMVLPQSMFTEYIVTGSLAAWARAYKLRSDEHSQKEIRDLAEEWQKIIGSIKELEYSWRALTI